MGELGGEVSGARRKGGSEAREREAPGTSKPGTRGGGGTGGGDGVPGKRGLRKWGNRGEGRRRD